jgi:hypothetical protein
MLSPTEYGIAGTALSGVITWLISDRLRLQSAHDKEKAERQKFHEAHLGDLNSVIKAHKELIDRFQAHTEKQSADAIVQERASMALIVAMGERMNNVAIEMRQAVSTAISLRSL